MNNSALSEKSVILFVEDEPNMRNLVEKVFLEKEYKLVTAPNGVRAMELLVQITPDLIVSDIMMPEMNGIEFFEAVQSRYGDKRPAFMFLTAKSEEDDIIAGLSLGADDYITKPVSIRQLVSKIESKMKQIQAQKKHLSTGLRGNLNDQHVADIIQFIELAEHTGKLTIDYRNREGQIQFRKGQIVWADFPPLSGADAVYVMIALESGSFFFESTENVIQTNRIKADNFALILEAMKRIDETGRENLLNVILDEPKVFSPLESLTENKSLSLTDTLPIAVISPPDEPEIGDDIYAGDTFQMKALKLSSDQETEKSSITVTSPDWVHAFDFSSLSRMISELEFGDFSGLWIKPDELLNTTDRLRTEPSCIFFAPSDKLLGIFRILSEIFMISPPNEHNLPKVIAPVGHAARFHIQGYPLEFADIVPDSFPGIPYLIYLPSNELDLCLPLLRSLHPAETASSMVVVSENPELFMSAMEDTFPQSRIPAVAGNFSTWLSSLLALSRGLKAFNLLST